MVSHQKQKMFKFRNKKPVEKTRPLNRCQRCSVCGDRGQCEVQLDWVWQPLAAKMSTNSTDMVYWTPPLYNSNITEATNAATNTPTSIQSVVTARQQRSVRKKKFSSSRRRSKLMTNNSITKEIEEENGSTDKEDDYNSYCSDERKNSRITDEDSISKKMEDTSQLETTSPQQGSVRKKKLSSSRRRSKLIADDSIVEDLEVSSQSEVPDLQQGSVRKKKLSSSRRRSRLMTNNSTTEELEESGSTDKEDDYSTYCSDDRKNNSNIVSESLPDYCDWENQNDNDIEINEKAIEKTHENDCNVTSLEMESSSEFDIDKEILMHNSLIQNTPDAVKYNSNKPNKLTSSTTLLKLIEKFSHLQVLPGIMQKKNKANALFSESNKFSNKKNKRPSIKVYKRHTQRTSSVRSNKAAHNQEVINTIAKPLLSAQLSIKSIHSKQTQLLETQSGFYDQSDTDNEDAISNMENLRNAQLQTMLQILSQLYEKKLSRQQTEMQHLRTHIQTQEKLMLQLVHVTMNLKGDLDKVKNNQTLVNDFTAVNEVLKETEQLNNAQSIKGNYNTIIDIGDYSHISPKNNDHVLTIKCGEFDC